MRTLTLLVLATLTGCSFPTGEFQLRPGEDTGIDTAVPDDLQADTTEDTPEDVATDEPVDVPLPPVDAGCGDLDHACCTDLTQPGGCMAGLVCAHGTCAAACPSGEASCAAACTSLSTDPANCGACGTACVGADHATPACTAGVCALVCASGWADCDGNARNGCEAAIATDASNCGSCGNHCVFANASATCQARVCRLGACNPGWGDCDGDVATGCEAPFTTSNDHCGMCRNVCGTGTYCACPTAMPSCERGSCQICGGAGVNCSGHCVNVSADVNNCGACGTVCQARPNAAATCMGRVCGIACLANFGDCNRSALDGCEIDLRTSVSNCGTCGRTCTVANGSPTCAGGACVVASCTTGWGNCDGDPNNGCETRLASNPNCGACGVSCSLANAASVCTARGSPSVGVCTVTGCNSGYENCDRMDANGCEASLAFDAANCGRCGNVCPTVSLPHMHAACSSGACTSTCDRGWGDCDRNRANGCEMSCPFLRCCF